MKTTNNGGKNGAGSIHLVLAVIAVLALAMLGAVLYMQYAEQSYYQEPPSVWPGAPASGAASAPASSPNLALPPAETSVLPSGAPVAPASTPAETSDVPAAANTAAPPSETLSPAASNDAGKVD